MKPLDLLKKGFRWRNGGSPTKMLHKRAQSSRAFRKRWLVQGGKLQNRGHAPGPCYEWNRTGEAPEWARWECCHGGGNCGSCAIGIHAKNWRA